MSLKTVNDGYYGDETRWFVGVVEDIKDPLKQGRVRVRIFGVHSANHGDIPSDALPWAQCVAPVTHGGTSGINGTPVGIKPYAQVFGMFLDGKHSQLPLVLGSIPKVDGPNNPRQRSGVAPTGQLPNTVDGVANYSGTRPASTIPNSGGSNAERVYNILEDGFRRDFGYTNSKELAAGFVGNFMAESGAKLNPLAYNPAGGGKGAHGIAQWRADRFDNLLKFAASEKVELFTNAGGYQVPDVATQARFVLQELKTTEGHIRKWGPKANTARLAGSLVEEKYERAYTDLRGKSFDIRYNSGTSIKKRIDNAADVFNTFAHRVSSAPVQSNAQ